MEERSKNELLDLWKPNSTRSRYNDFKPIALEIEGIEDEDEYNSILKYAEERAKEDHNTILIKDACIFAPDFTTLQEIRKDLPTMNLDHITSKDLIMFDNQAFNEAYLSAMNRVYAIAKQYENFASRSQQENFICQQIVLSVKYLTKLHYSSEYYPKVIYYNRAGKDIEKRDYYFLQLCSIMNMDVIVFNPNGYIQSRPESIFKTDHSPLSRVFISFDDRAKSGKELNIVRTSTATISDQLEDQLFTDTGVYKAWMFRNGDMKPQIISGTVEDLELGWGIESRLREGFKADVKKKNIIIPVFLTEIQGIYKNKEQYTSLFLKLASEKNSILCRNANDLTIPKDKNRMYQLLFIMEPDGTFKYEKLKTVQGYCLDRLSEEDGILVVKNLNKLLKSLKYTQKDDIVLAVDTILRISTPLRHLIENYDYPFAIPKIIVFLEKEQSMDEGMNLLLLYLSIMGFDIVIFAPAGKSGCKIKNLQQIRLDTLSYEEGIPQSKKEEGKKALKNFLKSIFTDI